MSSSDEEEQIEVDADTCNTIELNNLFDNSLRLSCEEAISLQKEYILYLDAPSDFSRLAAATSNKSVHIYDINNRKGLSQLSQCDINPLHSPGSDSICGVRFAHTDANTLFVATISGKISLYDLRTDPSAKQTFECADIQLKPFTCFDLNVSDTTLCAGTEQSSSEAYLVFFDKRQNKMLNAYTDSHENDLTQVKFHPINHNVLASGSTDGLINVFDTTEPTEDDALVFCLNTESSIQKIDWHPKDTISEEPTNHLSCITDTNDFQWFDVEDSELMFQFDRSEIAKLTKRKAPSHCYLVDCHTDSNGETFLLVGSNYNRGECLRSLTLRKDKFVPRNSFSDNKQIIRCSSFNSKANVLFTAGEGGIISVWEPTSRNETDTQKLKQKVKTKDSRKSKPY